MPRPRILLHCIQANGCISSRPMRLLRRQHPTVLYHYLCHVNLCDAAHQHTRKQDPASPDSASLYPGYGLCHRMR